MIPYEELDKKLRADVLGEAAKLTVSHFAESPGAKPREVAYVAMKWRFSTGEPFQWDCKHQDKFSVCKGAEWVGPYAITAAINDTIRLKEFCGDFKTTSKKLRKQFDTVEVPMADVIDYIQELCRRATGEADK